MQERGSRTIMDLTLTYYGLEVLVIELALGALFVLFLGPKRVERNARRMFEQEILPRITVELGAILHQADERIKAAQEQISAAMAAAQSNEVEADDDTKTASAMGLASGQARRDFAVMEEVVEAAISKAMPALAPVVITTAKGMFPKLWKQTVKQGPEALPAMWERMKGFIPANVTGAASTSTPALKSSW